MNLKDTLLKAGLKVSEDNVRRKEFDSVRDVTLPYCLDNTPFNYLDIFQDVKFFEANRQPLTTQWMNEHNMKPIEKDRVYDWILNHINKCYRVCSYDEYSKKLGVMYGHCCFFVCIIWDARTKRFSLTQGADGIHSKYYEYAEKHKYTEFLDEWLKETPWIPVLVDKAVSNDGVHLNYERRECVWSYGCNILNSKRESVKNGLEDLEKLGGSIDPKKKYIVRMAISNGRCSSTIREWIPKTAWTREK